MQIIGKSHKFVYGASIRFDYWTFSKKTDKMAKFLIRNFTWISFREIGTIKYAKEHLDINASFVLDPTMLINKKYYLDIINNYKGKNYFINQSEYILIYKIGKMKNMESFIKKVKTDLNYKIIKIIVFYHGVFWYYEFQRKMISFFNIMSNFYLW